MFYKPKYCCECGEKIENPDRKFFSSGRYCDVCKEDFKLHEWFPLMTAAGGILLCLLGFGGFWQADEKPLNRSVKQFAVNPPPKKETALNKNAASENSNARASANADSQSPAEKQLPPAPKLTEQRANETAQRNAADTEPTYFCGAATKKGTACSRRVKGGGRCWQHTGQAAILPPEKLIVSR